MTQKTLGLRSPPPLKEFAYKLYNLACSSKNELIVLVNESLTTSLYRDRHCIFDYV